MTNEEKANQIAWEYSKHYDPNCCKQVWVEMGAREMAEWKEQEMIEKAVKWLTAYLVDYLQCDEQIIEDFKQAMKGEIKNEK